MGSEGGRVLKEEGGGYRERGVLIFGERRFGEFCKKRRKKKSGKTKEGEKKRKVIERKT